MGEDPSSHYPKVNAVVMNWNGLRWLEKCLPSLIAQDYPNLSVIVVDCNSTDGSAEWVRQHCPQAILRQIPYDCSPPHANNLIAREYACDWVCILNNDVVLPSDCIRTMVRVAGTAPPLAIVNPVQLRWTGDFFGVGFSPSMIAMWYPWLRLLLSRFARPSDSPFYACTACCLVARTTLLRYPLNEDLFIYEELDWSWRILAAGGAMISCEETAYFHAGQSTLRDASSRQLRIIGRNDAASLWLNATPLLLLLLLPFYSAYYLRLTLSLFYRRKQVRSLWLGLRECFRMRSIWSAERRRRRGEQRRSSWAIFCRMVGSVEFARQSRLRWQARWPEPWRRPASGAMVAAGESES